MFLCKGVQCLVVSTFLWVRADALGGQRHPRHHVVVDCCPRFSFSWGSFVEGTRSPCKRVRRGRYDNHHPNCYDSHTRLYGTPSPDDDDDQSSLLLVDVVHQTASLLVRPLAANLPAGVLFALAALPFVATSLVQTVLTLVLFVALAVLGRSLGNEYDDDDGVGNPLLLVPAAKQDDDAVNTAWTDVFALLMAGSTAYLVVPPLPAIDTTSTNNNDLAQPAVGLALLGATVAILSFLPSAGGSRNNTGGETSLNNDSNDSDENGILQGKVNGINGELLEKWDEELRWRESQKQNTPRRNDDY